MEEIITGCPFDCGGSCPLLAHIDEGKVKRLSPVEEADSQAVPASGPVPGSHLGIPAFAGMTDSLRPCARGLSQVERIYHPERLLYPMKRTGQRGEGKFQRISWGEALETTASRLRYFSDKHGPESILNLRGTGSLDGILHRTGALADRFFNCFGGCTTTRGIISFEGASFAARNSFGLVPAPPGPESLMKSRLVIMWGINPSETVFGTNTSYYLALAKEAGVKFIFVDPRYSDSAAALADRWISILPGTDTAMLIAMANVIIEENLFDRSYLEKYTSGFEEFKGYCLGIKDGRPRNPEWAESICGVRAEVIANLARDYASTKPADLRGGWAPGRTAFGEQFHRACIALAALTGNIGIPGGGPGCWVSQNFSHTLGVTAVTVLESPLRKKTVLTWRWADAVLRGTAGGYPSDIKMIYSLGGNRLNQCADINRGLEALKKVEFVVVQDQFMTPMARFADILLPASTHFEREDIQTPHNSGHYLIYNHKVIEPLGESMSDLEILTRLAERLDIQGFNTKTEQEWLREFMSKSPVNVDELKAKGLFRSGSSPGQVPLQEFIADPQKNPLPAPSGKIELSSQAMAQKKRPLLPSVPQYIEEWEGPKSELAGKYPLLLVTTHSRKTVNSTFDNISWLRELEEHTAWINPVDAGARKIKEGDLVRVFSQQGELSIKARLTERIMPGVVGIDQGAWYQPDEKGIDRAGSVNVLCKDTVSPAEASATNAILVEISREGK